MDARIGRRDARGRRRRRAETETRPETTDWRLERPIPIDEVAVAVEGAEKIARRESAVVATRLVSDGE